LHFDTVTDNKVCLKTGHTWCDRVDWMLTVQGYQFIDRCKHIMEQRLSSSALLHNVVS